MVEYKVQWPTDATSYAKILKSIAAMANCRGGYILFGISDCRQLVGLDKDISTAQIDRLNALLVRKISPQIDREYATIEIEGRRVFVIYIVASKNKPCIASEDHTGEFKEGAIYYRYFAQSRAISAPELVMILAERDARARSGTAA